MKSVRKPLPPYGNHYLNDPRNGVQVAIGPTSWDFAKTRRYPVMVLRDGKRASEFRWPTSDGPALVHECGSYDDEALDALAQELLKAGSTSVVAIREALLNNCDPRVFYDAEVLDVTA